MASVTARRYARYAVLCALSAVLSASLSCVRGNPALDAAPELTPDELERVESFLASETASANEGAFPPAPGGSGSLRVVCFQPIGFTETSGGRYLFGDVLDQFWAVSASGVGELGGSAYPARVLVRDSAGGLVPVQVEAPRLGQYAEDLERLFPESVRDRLDGTGRGALFARAVEEVRAWAGPLLPPDRLVELERPDELADPHGHEEPIYELMSLDVRYDGLTVVTELPASQERRKDWESGPVSPSGAYRVYYDPSGGSGIVVERTADGRLSSVRNDSAYGQLYPAAWKDDVTLAVDRVDVSSDPIRSVTHIEIDAETLEIMRAVPLGPLGFGRRVGQ